MKTLTLKSLSALTSTDILSAKEVTFWASTAAGAAALNRFHLLSNRNVYLWARLRGDAAAGAFKAKRQRKAPPAPFTDHQAEAERMRRELRSIADHSPYGLLMAERKAQKALIATATPSEAATPRALVASTPDTIGAHSLSVIAGGSFDVPLFETRAEADRGMIEPDQLEAWLLSMALSAASKAKRAIEGGRLRRSKGEDTTATINLGKLCGVSDSGFDRVATVGAEWKGGARTVNEATAADGLGAAIASLWRSVSRMFGRNPITGARINPLRLERHGAEVFLPDSMAQWAQLKAQSLIPANGLGLYAGEGEAPTLQHARRRWLWRQALKAASKAMTTLGAGMTGDRTASKLPKLESIGAPEDWGRLKVYVETEDTSGPIPRATRSKALRLAAKALGAAPCPPASDRKAYNARQAQLAIRRRLRFVAMLLRGNSEDTARELAGLPATFSVDGKLTDLLQKFGLTAAELRGQIVKRAPAPPSGWFACFFPGGSNKGERFAEFAKGQAFADNMVAMREASEYCIAGPFESEPEARRMAQTL